MKKESRQQHIRLDISGRVQGVGFRPYVFQLARRLKLKGKVCNTSTGVQVHLQGDLAAIDDFEDQLTKKPPVQALIKSIKNRSQPLADYSGFEIVQSMPLDRLTTFNPFTKINSDYQIPLDTGACSQCVAEFNDPTNRRYLDPFINCSDCGPRYTVMHSLPYDRQRTSMAKFKLCTQCESEYQNPLDRRYHTQGLCCPDCGPEITLYNARYEALAESEEAIKNVAQILSRGGIVAFKGLGGFHILCDATNPEAVARLRKNKSRSAKPFAVLCANLEMAETIAETSTYEQGMLVSGINPIVLVTKKTESCLTDLVAPDSHRLGLFLAQTGLQHLLFKYIDKPLIATSANRAADPILYDADTLFHSLCRSGAEQVDYVLDFDREITNPCDDSIVQIISNSTNVVLRLGRGLAPYYGDFSYEKLSEKGKQSKANIAMMAVGAQQKSSIAFGHRNQWMLSPYMGDLGSLASELRFDESFSRLQNLTQSLFNQVACDRHPDYVSSQWAERFCQRNKWSLLKVPHHYAHVLACMAEFRLTEPVLAFSWDGLGLGTDDTIWGGEVFLASEKECYRVDHLRPFRLLGGDLANQQPKRIALAQLFDLMPLKTVMELDLPSVKSFSEFEIHQLYKIYKSGLNAPESSSIGRVFDAVASMIGLVQISEYEGQAGLQLEGLYDESVTAAYDFTNESGVIDLEPMWWQIIEDQQKGLSHSEIVSQFFNLLLNLIESISDRLVGFPVMVTGGVFQNKVLLEQLCKRFEHRPQPFYFQQHTPINDGSIALGQLWWAMHNEPQS